MIKNILAFIGAIVLVVVAIAYLQFGGMISKVGGLDKGALPAYMAMFEKVLKDGDPAKAMMIEAKIADDVTNDDAVEAIKAITEDRNMRVTGDVKMFTKEDAKPNEIKHARIISVCNLTTAKIFLNYSRYYGGFMPCRIMLVEYGNGDRYLVTMNLDLAIYGGKKLPPEMLEAALKVKDTMETLIRDGA
ncbi:MAG: DUF302 domain-containing protein, partial [Epsilonproteobacteria bacterium]|nr:DUF302 domain-containing protein [Campylobacterota bacterium]